MSRHRSNRSSQRKTADLPVLERPRWHLPIGLALILLVTCAAYLPAMSGGVLWDDDAHLTKPELQSAAGLSRIWFEPGATQQYYPLLHSAFWLEHALWGDSVQGYHAVNLLWHLIAVSLVYVILIRLKIPGALLAAAIFAFHPVMVESVAWITEQKNTLSAVFYLGAMWAYLAFDESRSKSNYFLALALFLLGLLTKTVTATLPAALLVIFWWQRGAVSWKRDVLPLLPFFVLGAVAGLTTAWVERRLIGAEGADFDLSLVQRSLLAGRVIWFYAAKLVWPANLIFIYPRWQIQPSVWWQWLFPAAALGTTAALWAVRHKSRAPLAGWIYFVGTLFPVLGFLNVYPFIYSYVADHFQYLASLGLIVLAAAGMARAFAHLSQNGKLAGAGLCVLMIGSLAVLTWRQSHMYADSITLYQTTLERNPNWLCHFNLAWDLSQAHRDQEAIEHYRSAINLRPTYPDNHNNMGRLLINLNQLDEAIKEFQAAIQLKPDFYQAYNNLGIAFDHQGRYPEAIESLQHCIRLASNFSEAYQNMGNTLMRMGRLPEAIENIEHALRLKPDDSEAENNMGVVLAQNGKVPEAIEHFRKAVVLNPQDPKSHANLGKTLMGAGNYQEAAVHLQHALQLQPGRADLYSCLGEILSATGRVDEAIQQFQTSLRLDPNIIETYIDLASAMGRAKRTGDAIAIGKRAIEVAKSTGQKNALQAAEEWLARYQAELNQPEKKSP